MSTDRKPITTKARPPWFPGFLLSVRFRHHTPYTQVATMRGQ